MSGSFGAVKWRWRSAARIGRGAAAAVLCTAVARSASAQCHYDVTFVPNPTCGALGHVNVQFYGINEHGQACGSRGRCAFDTTFNDPLPMVWTPDEGMIMLPLPEGATRGVANDINDVLGTDGFGQVACTLEFPGQGDQPYLYDDGTWIPLGVPGEGAAINDATEIAGSAGSPLLAFVWHDGNVTVLDLPIGPNRAAHDISEISSVVGWMGEGGTHFSAAFLLTQRSIITIPLLAKAVNSKANAVSNHDVVAGESMIPVKSGPIPRRSWIFENGKLTDLGLLPNTIRCIAEDINDAGQIVGACYLSSGAARPFIWQNGVLTDLFDLYDGTSLQQPHAINNHGQIAGWGGGGGVILTPADHTLGDLNFDCAVDAVDLLILLDDWGPCPVSGPCPCDIVNTQTLQPPGDGVVNGADLAIVLDSWSISSHRDNPTRR